MGVSDDLNEVAEDGEALYAVHKLCALYVDVKDGWCEVRSMRVSPFNTEEDPALSARRKAVVPSLIA